MNELQTNLVFTFVSIFAMVNPIGMAPVFLEKTKGQPLQVRHFLAYKVAIYGTLMLIVALFAGLYVLRAFRRFAGGHRSGWEDFRILHGLGDADRAGRVRPGACCNVVRSADDIAFFPLTMPITAGAGSLAISISLSSKIMHSGQDFAAGYVGAVLGILLVFACVAVCYRFSDAIFERIGRVGTNVLTRLTAFFLLAIGVDVTWGGLKLLIASLSQ